MNRRPNPKPDTNLDRWHVSSRFAPSRSSSSKYEGEGEVRKDVQNVDARSYYSYDNNIIAYVISARLSRASQILSSNSINSISSRSRSRREYLTEYACLSF